MTSIERLEPSDRRQPRSSADDLHQRLDEKIAEIEMERREGSRRQAEERKAMSLNPLAMWRSSERVTET